jgi:cytochrome c-type biogenesis protein CcmH
MIVLLILIFGSLAFLAAAFAVVPLYRRTHGEGRTRLVLAGGAGLAVLVCGLGAYAFLGQPQLALRALQGPDNSDFPSLISALADRIRERPNDVQGWVLLGRGYLALGRPDQAVKALGRAVTLAKAQEGRASPNFLADLLVSYGQALALQGDTIPKEAEAAFREAVEEDPKNVEGRYYLGFAYAQRGDAGAALKIWEGLAADAPPDAPWRKTLIDQMAALKSRATPGTAGPPNIAAMVQRLASRLEANPKDIDGWVMLIRAYAVLGDKDKAAAALAKARALFAGDADALRALDAQAKDSALN